MMGFHFHKGDEVPVITKEMRETYLKRRLDELDRCRSALKEAEWDLISRVGHKIKGNAETFGFESLTNIGNEIETAAQAKNPVKVSESLDQLARVLELETLDPSDEH